MGSNPISPTIGTLVFDTPPLQALHRCRSLDVLREAYPRVIAPGAVFDETARSLAAVGGEKVPRLEDHPWIVRVDLTDEEISAVGGFQIDRPRLEAIIIAKREGGRVVMEDRVAVRRAREQGVPVLKVADLLVELERAGRINDADARAKMILETGYFSKELRWLSQRAYP